MEHLDNDMLETKLEDTELQALNQTSDTFMDYIKANKKNWLENKRISVVAS